jgi:hypothetical protein
LYFVDRGVYGYGSFLDMPKPVFGVMVRPDHFERAARDESEIQVGGAGMDESVDVVSPDELAAAAVVSLDESAVGVSLDESAAMVSLDESAVGVSPDESDAVVSLDDTAAAAVVSLGQNLQELGESNEATHEMKYVDRGMYGYGSFLDLPKPLLGVMADHQEVGDNNTSTKNDSENGVGGAGADVSAAVVSPNESAAVVSPDESDAVVSLDESAVVVSPDELAAAAVVSLGQNLQELGESNEATHEMKYVDRGMYGYGSFLDLPKPIVYEMDGSEEGDDDGTGGVESVDSDVVIEADVVPVVKPVGAIVDHAVETVKDVVESKEVIEVPIATTVDASVDHSAGIVKDLVESQDEVVIAAEDVPVMKSINSTLDTVEENDKDLDDSAVVIETEDVPLKPIDAIVEHFVETIKDLVEAQDEVVTEAEEVPIATPAEDLVEFKDEAAIETAIETPVDATVDHSAEIVKDVVDSIEEAVIETEEVPIATPAEDLVEFKDEAAIETAIVTPVDATVEHSAETVKDVVDSIEEAVIETEVPIAIPVDATVEHSAETVKDIFDSKDEAVIETEEVPIAIPVDATVEHSAETVKDVVDSIEEDAVIETEEVPIATPVDATVDHSAETVKDVVDSKDEAVIETEEVPIATTVDATVDHSAETVQDLVESKDEVVIEAEEVPIATPVDATTIEAPDAIVEHAEIIKDLNKSEVVIEAEEVPTVEAFDLIVEEAETVKYLEYSKEEVLNEVENIPVVKPELVASEVVVVLIEDESISVAPPLNAIVKNVDTVVSSEEVALEVDIIASRDAAALISSDEVVLVQEEVIFVEQPVNMESVEAAVDVSEEVALVQDEFIPAEKPLVEHVALVMSSDELESASKNVVLVEEEAVNIEALVDSQIVHEEAAMVEDERSIEVMDIHVDHIEDVGTSDKLDLVEEESVALGQPNAVVDSNEVVSNYLIILFIKLTFRRFRLR